MSNDRFDDPNYYRLAVVVSFLRGAMPDLFSYDANQLSLRGPGKDHDADSDAPEDAAGELEEADGIQEADLILEPVATEEIKLFKNLVGRYFQRVSEHLVESHEVLCRVLT